MRILNLYADDDGESHFRDISIDWQEQAVWGRLSKQAPTIGLTFVEAHSDAPEWHPAPNRQYVINLAAAFEVTASDGERRIVATGDVILVEDTAGKGHQTRFLDVGAVHRVAFITIP